MAPDVVGQFSDPFVGLSHLRHARRQPQQRDVALLNNGEGWHNNHHADSRSARHGHAWWELDVAWLTIRLLMLLGLAGNVSLPSRKALARRSASRPHSIGSNV